MKSGETVEKRPNEVKDYTFKWRSWLSGDTISTSTTTVDDGITKDSESNGTDSATVWISGGSKGNTYKIVNKIVTAAGRTAEEYFFIKVVDPTAKDAWDYQYNS